MKVGSIIQCVVDASDSIAKEAVVYRIPVVGEVLTVRKIWQSRHGHTLLSVDEYVFGVHMVTGQEMGGSLTIFREIQSPEEGEMILTEALEETLQTT